MLHAGAARIDYTLRGAELPGNFTGVLDPIFVRTLVLDNGSTRAAIGAVNAEVHNAIAQRLKRESPFKHTMMTTLTNGMAQTGYIPGDEAFGFEVFTVLSSRLKPGCAETGIVSGLLELMRGL